MKVKYSKLVLKYLEDLVDILIEKDYFSFYDSAAKYVDDIFNEIETTIHLKIKHKAPEYFSKYGQNMFYFSYNRNKQTTWYIFFTIHGKNKNQYLIQYITNNHSEGQYI
jgi:hypothetical protein